MKINKKIKINIYWWNIQKYSVLEDFIGSMFYSDNCPFDKIPWAEATWEESAYLAGMLVFHAGKPKQQLKARTWR